MANSIPIKARARSSRPNNLFLLTRCVEIFGVLDAAILADLFYWITQGDEPWRKAQDHADLFAVNEKTIREHSQILAIKHKCFGRRDSMLKNGKKGACKYFSIKSENSKALYSQYLALFNRGLKKTDFGHFEYNEVTEIPNFITLPVVYIERLKNINLAYLLVRLYWITFSENPNPIISYSSQAKLARDMLLNRTTLIRYLNLLQNYNYLTHTDQSNGIVISINTDSDLYEILSDWISKNQEARRELIMESNY